MTKIIVIGDIYVDPDTIAFYAKNLKTDEELKFYKYNWENRSKEHFRIRYLNIEKNGPEAEEYPKEIEREITDADIILTHISPVPAKLIDQAKSLKLIGTCRGGTEHIDLLAAAKRNIPVINCIRNAEPVADFTLGLIYAETRNIARSHLGMMNRSWMKEFENSFCTTVLSEQKVGLIGLGYIGKLLAGKLAALNVEVWGYDPYVSQEDLDSSGIKVIRKELEEIFSTCEIVSLHLRLTEETNEIIDKKFLKLMKKNAYLINTSRAGVVNKADLYEVLSKNKIAGAALDVFWEEPIKKNDPFLELRNVTLTPHLAGDTVDAIPKCPKMLVKEINDYLENNNYKMI